MAKSRFNNQNEKNELQVQEFTMVFRPENAMLFWSPTVKTSSDLEDLLRFAADLLRQHGTVRVFSDTSCLPEYELFSVKKKRDRADDKMTYRVVFTVFVSDVFRDLDVNALYDKMVATKDGNLQERVQKRDVTRQSNPGTKIRVVADIGHADLTLDEKALKRQQESFACTALSVATAVSGLLLYKTGYCELGTATV